MAEFKNLIRIIKHQDYDLIDAFLEISERVRGGEYPEHVLEDFGVEADYFFQAVALAKLSESEIRLQFGWCA